MNKAKFDTMKQPIEIAQAAAYISDEQAQKEPVDVNAKGMEGLDYYTVEQVMAVLKVTRRTLYNYIKARQIDAVKMGRNWRITRPALERFMANGTTADYLERLRG